MPPAGQTRAMGQGVEWAGGLSCCRTAGQQVGHRALGGVGWGTPSLLGRFMESVCL